ncbi:ataxin-10 isoform X1 [Podarcis lilfordi]|uniref:Ataxin-10 n=1 Tax=Podarcis lilfordi TaxID=74358 RepID=A0AA35KAL8_9SAUR|nr:ataxin-10 isoform X1 [Podarcis lilfordi]
MASSEAPLGEEAAAAAAALLAGLAARLTGSAEEQEEREEQAAAAAPGRLATLGQLAALLRDPAGREKASESLFQDLLQILRKASYEIDVTYKQNNTLEHTDSLFLLVSECFRCLRNACVQCTKNQNVMRNLGLIEASVHLIQLLHKLETNLESLLTAFRCSLQFLGNIAAGNKASQHRIWTLAFPSLFLNCLKHQDEKVVSYCCMVLFTCLNPERTRELQEESNLNVALAVLQASRKYPESEWTFLIVTNHLLKCPELVKAMYAKLSNQERASFLELIQSEIGENDTVISAETAKFLVNCFKEKCQAVLILAFAANDDDEEALVTIRLVDVLCEMTSNSGHLECLQACPDLLEVTVKTLQLTHLAGKQSTNIFTVTHSGQEQSCHPAVGFKSHLIRLIGNLCYKNKANQDKVYDLDGIPLILDNCSIDDNNPFVSQWAVYTIRNLTEQNERNQELIARMEQQGLADNSVLENMGLKVEKRDQKLILRSSGKTPHL